MIMHGFKKYLYPYKGQKKPEDSPLYSGFSSLGTTFKILYFVVKKRMAVWVHFSKFLFCCKKTKWPFGYSFKILHFSVKNEWPFGYTHLKNIISFTISCHSEQFLEKRKSSFSGKYTETYLGRFQTFTMEQDGTFWEKKLVAQIRQKQLPGDVL